MITISDIIEAKQRILARYETPEYIAAEISKGRTYTEVVISNIGKSIALNDLVNELCDIELAAQKAKSPVNIEEKE